MYCHAVVVGFFFFPSLFLFFFLSPKVQGVENEGSQSSWTWSSKLKLNTKPTHNTGL